MEPIVTFSHVTMDFPGIRANDDVSFSVNPGEIFALVGENGAGKSTLMNLLYGMLTPSGGEIWVKGEKITHFSPKNAISRGIGMVHQHFMLVDSFTVAENVVLCREPRRGGLFCDRAKAARLTEALSREYGLSVQPGDRVGDLTVGQQQRVEILKTLYRGADILILDEPTAVLTPQETAELFRVLRKMTREKGVTVILITHKLYEVMEISDRVGVMRQGRLVALEQTASVTQRQLAAQMVGRDMPQETQERPETGDAVLLEVTDLHAADNRGLPALRGVSLKVRSGEILGIAAVEGNGQSELLEAVAGMRPYTGEIRLLDVCTRGMDPGRIRALGFAHVPEDRLATGVDRDASIRDNLLAGRLRSPALARWGIHLRRKAMERSARELYDAFDIRSAGTDTAVGSLSGGNMQKVVIAREFSTDARVYAVAQPTRGVDIGASQFIHSRILEKRAGGAAILLSSADLDEVLRLSDRVITLYEGRITGEFDPSVTSKEEIGYHMTGHTEEAAHETEI